VTSRATTLRLVVLYVLASLVPPASASAFAAKTPVAQAKSSSKSQKARSSRLSRARRLRLARARAAARARELREAQTPKFRLGDSGELVPDVRAEAAVVYNPVTGEILWEENARAERSIASITKVMTAVVFLEGHPDLSDEVLIEWRDVRAASTTYLRAGERLKLYDVLHLLLVASDNAAARVLARVSVWGAEGFVDRMTEKAIEFGLEHTSYADPSGLRSDNVSSAIDMARLIAYAATDERLAPIMRKPSYTFSTSRRKTVTVNNTNKLLGDGVEVEGGKTGFISRAGYCLATLLRLPQGDPIAVVVLGARSSALRFWETKHLFNWIAGHASELLTRQEPDRPR
jgi:D-alanyl-D-alanine endopeptidase (penicillin-binding protein 7)